MAIRMQQRRGTAAQWTSGNPTLAAGEIGFETDTGKFKLGNGSSNWASLNYFVDANSILDGAPGVLNTLNELAAALGDDPAFFTTVTTNLSNHEADTTNVHGIANTAVLATQTDITNHNSDTTHVHGIADTSVLATNTSVAGDISSHNSLTTNVHGIANTAVLATQTDITSLDNTKAPKNNPTFTGNVILPSTTEIGEVSATEIGYVNGVTSAIQAQLDAKAPSASPTFTGTVVLPSTTNIGNVTNTQISYLDGVTSQIQTQLNSKASSQDANLTGIPTAPTATAGTNTVQIATTAFVSTAVSNLVNGAPAALDTINELAAALGNDQNYASTITNSLALKAPLAGPTFTGTVTLPSTTSIGNVSSTEIGYIDGVTSSIQSQIDGKAPAQSPTFTGTVTLPGTTSIGNVSSTEIGYIDGVTSSIQTQINTKAPVNAPTFTGLVTVEASGIAFTDGTQTKEGVPSRTTINSATGAYNLSTGGLALRDTLIECNSASAFTVTIPANSTTAYPVGTSIDLLQTGAGQITIAGAAGVTVNGTPGLKLRTQWSSATLFKRATDTWVVMGDLSA